MVPAAFAEQTTDVLAALMEPGDIVIDGGNSYYRDDIDRAEALAPQGHPLRRRRHERRRVRPRARLLPDDRRRGRGRRAPRSDLRDARARRRRRSSARRAAPAIAATAELGYLHCGPDRAPATSSRWSTTASSTASWPPTPRASTSSSTPTSARSEREADAETTPLRDPEYYQYDLDIADVAEVWRRGSVVASWLLDLTAEALVEDPDLDDVRRARVRLGRGPLDDRWPRSTRACRRRC